MKIPKPIKKTTEGMKDTETITPKSPLKVPPTTEMIDNFKSKTATKIEPPKSETTLDMISIPNFTSRSEINEEDKWISRYTGQEIDEFKGNLESLGVITKDNIKIFTNEDKSITYVFFTNVVETLIDKMVGAKQECCENIFFICIDKECNLIDKTPIINVSSNP